MKNAEKIIASLSNKLSTSIFDKAPSKTELVLTENILSGVGRSYITCPIKLISFSGSIKDISSIAIEYRSNWILLIIGVLTLPVYFLGIIFLIIYSFDRQYYIVVNFQGVKYALSIKEFSAEKVEGFIQKVLERQLEINRNP